MPNILIKVPKDVFPAEARKVLLKRVNEVTCSVSTSITADNKRVLATSIILNDVADGTWGANGNLWQLGDFAKAAGYGHLQHLIGVAQQ
jgi:phenylpyruvate tautomerase PptA (4-oxalocrotonate tautomerase family)